MHYSTKSMVLRVQLMLASDLAPLLCDFGLVTAPL